MEIRQPLLTGINILHNMLPCPSCRKFFKQPESVYPAPFSLFSESAYALVKDKSFPSLTIWNSLHQNLGISGAWVLPLPQWQNALQMALDWWVFEGFVCWGFFIGVSSLSKWKIHMSGEMPLGSISCDSFSAPGKMTELSKMIRIEHA